MFAGPRAAGNPFNDANARSLELCHFVGIVRQQADLTQSECLEGFGSKRVIARVIRKSEAAIRFHGVEPGILQFVGFELIDQTNSAPFLRKVEQHSRWRGCNFSERKLELCAAIAALGREHVTGEALRMQTHERRLSIARSTRLQSAVLNRDCFFAFLRPLDAKNSKSAESGRQIRFGDNARFSRSFAGLFFVLHRKRQL